MAHNPYAPPKAGVADARRPPVPDVPQRHDALFSPNQIVLAAFLGGPAAAASIAQANYKAIGADDEGRKIFAWSLALCAVLFLAGFLIPPKVPAYALPIAVVLAVRAAAEMRFGAIFKEHKAAGGEIGSWWRVVGVAILCLVLMFAVLFVGYMILAALGLVGLEGT